MKRKLITLALFVIEIFVILFVILRSLNIDGDIGWQLVSIWCSERDINNTSICLDMINSNAMVFGQALSLALFILMVISTIVNIEYRIAVAILAICMTILLGLVPPKVLIDKAISWDLILFLIGTMTLAGVLRSLGVFRYLAIQIIKIGKKNPYILVLLLMLLSYVTSAVLDETTSIIYVAMILLELANIIKTDIRPLLILSILATNTGSSALPIGNPIGIYIFYKSRMSIAVFMKYSLPLSLINLAILILVSFIITRSYIENISKYLYDKTYKINAYIAHYYTQLNGGNGVKKLVFGSIVLVIFVLAIVSCDFFATFITSIAGIEIDRHALLSFIPYICIALSFIKIRPEDIGRYIEKSVEWTSIIFFTILFMLSYTIMYTGAIVKIAYALATTTYNLVAMAILLCIISSVLSAFLDNLSVVVAFTPIAIMLSNLGLKQTLFFALLFGGVFGGNYTPIGSTANIIAISLSEKKNIKINWGSWIKIALIPTILQMMASVLWLYFI